MGFIAPAIRTQPLGLSELAPGSLGLGWDLQLCSRPTTLRVPRRRRNG